MPMNPNFLCCIGAELKNSTQQTTRMSQIYFYRAFEEETVADMLQPGFFDAAMGIVRKDDLLLLYDPKDEFARWTYCRVSNVDRSGVEISLMGVNAQDVLVEISGEDPITLQSLIDNTIMPAIENIGDMDLPVITDGGTAPTNLSEAIRQIVTQNLTLTEDSVEPQSGQFSLWGAIKKALENAKNFFSSISNLDTRLNALEGQGGPVGSYDFGKSFPNILDATDTQLVAGVMVDNIWAGHTPIVWTTPIANSTFTDGDGVDRTVGEIFNGTWIINSYDGTRIVLTNTPNTTPPIFSYQNVGVYSVGFANATTAGVVRVGTGSDMTVDQITGDISIDNTKGYSIFHRLISLFTSAEKTQIRSDLNTASRDMDDLSATGQNIANWSSNVSNCITYIPQDIKLEFSNGTITLKAGSKVYYPDGTYAIVASDSSITATNADALAYYNENGILGWVRKSECYAQPTAPTATQYMLWWDYTNNVMKHTSDNGSTWQVVGLPVCSFTANATQITELSRTFNGFGFMGPLVFMLPGVKMLIPNGRNADGSLKNIEWEADTVYKTNYRNWVSTGNQAVQMGPSVNNIWDRYVQTEYMPATNTYTLWYKPSENVLRVNNTGNNYTSEDQWTITTGGIYITSIGPGTNIDPIYYKQPGVCHTLDYTNTEYMCNQATPSGVAINLTPANNTYYKAPADGWFVAIGSGTGTNMWLELTSDIAQGVYGTVGWQYKVCLKVKKGASCELTFNNINFATFKFVYANGAIGWK